MGGQHLLKISLHGMNSRMQAMMRSYLELNCHGIAYIVEEAESDAEIVDIDLAESKNILEERLAQQPSKPIIVFSLYDVSFDVIYVKKPIKVDTLVNAIVEVKKRSLASAAALKRADDNSMPELAVLLNKKEQQEIKKQGTSAKSQSPRQLPKKKSAVIESPRPRPEIDRFLEDFNSHHFNKKSKKKSNRNTSTGNRRNTVRYVFQAISGCLKRNPLLGGFNSNLPVTVEAISSKGALIKVEKSLPVSKKVTLEIQLDPKNVFTIPATVIRQNSRSTYGLAFIDYQHKLTEYLIGSGRSFNIK